MAEFIRGDVVVVPFPFSNLSVVKRRPALVVSSLSGDDLILCQITSQNVSDSYSVSLLESDFVSGNLNKPSMIRPNKLFTSDSKIILYKIGNINKEKMGEVINEIVRIVTS